MIKWDSNFLTPFYASIVRKVTPIIMSIMIINFLTLWMLLPFIITPNNVTSNSLFLIPHNDA